MRKWININSEKCTGCRLCALICSYHNFGVISLAQSRIKIFYYPPGFDIPTLCRHCNDPKCLPACPNSAISKKKERIVMNEELCDGCGECVKACPYDGIFLNTATGKAINCNLCGQCVRECPNGCLVFEEEKEVAMSVDERAASVKEKLFDPAYCL